MKKIIYSAATVALLVTLSAGIGCKKDNPVSCTDRAKKYADATMAYQSDPSNKEKCKAFKSAAQEYFDGCSSTMSASEKEIINGYLASISCD